MKREQVVAFLMFLGTAFIWLGLSGCADGPAAEPLPAEQMTCSQWTQVNNENPPLWQRTCTYGGKTCTQWFAGGAFSWPDC